MSEFAVSDEKVKRQLMKEREESAQAEFLQEEWQSALELERQGRVKDTLDNLVTAIRYDGRLQSIAFNLHRDGIDAGKGLPWKQIKPGWNDSDFASLKVYLNKGYGVYSPSKTKDAQLAVASERAYHPVKKYLDGPDRFVDVEFLNMRGGKLRTIVAWAKMARGQMVRHIVKNRIDRPEDIKEFDWDGYEYEPSLSSEAKYVFIRRETKL